MADAFLVDGERCRDVPAGDRGLAYGDGVFRTLYVHAGRPVAWQTHMQRLNHDCAALQLPGPDAAQLAAEADTLFADGCDGVLKIMFTRGSGGRGYTPPKATSRRILSAHALPAHADQPTATLALLRSPIVLATQPALAGVKHLNRLEQVLARVECQRQGEPDALMCDGDGRVIGTTMRNLLFRDASGAWLTPRLTRAGVAGATRQRLMAGLEAEGRPVVERDIDLAMLAYLSVAVACNSVGGVVAVSRIDQYRFDDSEPVAADCRRLLEAG